MVCVSVVPLLVVVCAFILLLVGSHHHFELIEIHFSILVHVVSRNHLAGLILRQGDFTNLSKRRKLQSLLRSKVLEVLNVFLNSSGKSLIQNIQDLTCLLCLGWAVKSI